MLTTCPECRTTFRIDHAQLEARRGMVRCGGCRAVFNAYDTLLPEFDPASEPEAAPVPLSEENAGAAFDPSSAPDAVAEEAWPSPVGVATAEPEAEDEGFEALLSDPDSGGPPEAEPILDSAPVPEAAAETTDAILFSELPTRARIEPERPLWKTILFGFLSVLLVLALLGQTAYFLRGPIVQWLPELRMAFGAACKTLGCDIPLARQPEMLRVESSSLETDPEQPSRATLRVSFSNRSNSVQAWPHLILKLTDLRSAPLAQRIFKPKDYLPRDKAAQPGMAAMSELEFRLDLDLGGLTAAGYEVKPHYP